MNARRGHTLIEATVVISMFGLILSSVALALHATRQANRHVRDEAESQREMARFAAQLRSDAHQAASAKLEDSKKGGSFWMVLLLTLADGQTAEYSLQTERIERVLRRGQAVVHRETYRLPFCVTGKWQLQTSGRSPVISLLLEPAAGRSVAKTMMVPRRVDAVVRLFHSDLRRQNP